MMNLNFGLKFKIKYPKAISLKKKYPIQVYKHLKIEKQLMMNLSL